MDEKAVMQAIIAILKSGNNAVVQRKKDGVIVYEEKKTIKYSAQ